MLQAVRLSVCPAFNCTRDDFTDGIAFEGGKASTFGCRNGALLPGRVAFNLADDCGGDGHLTDGGISGLALAEVGDEVLDFFEGIGIGLGVGGVIDHVAFDFACGVADGTLVADAADVAGDVVAGAAVGVVDGVVVADGVTATFDFANFDVRHGISLSFDVGVMDVGWGGAECL